jgi:phage baseplate assembly protein W
MNPTFGVGLRKHIFKYNNDNTIAMIKNDIINQLKLWEPRVIAEKTEVARSGASSQSGDILAETSQHMNKLNLTVVLTTIYGTTATVEITDNDISKIV